MDPSQTAPSEKKPQVEESEQDTMMEQPAEARDTETLIKNRRESAGRSGGIFERNMSGELEYARSQETSTPTSAAGASERDLEHIDTPSQEPPPNLVEGHGDHSEASQTTKTSEHDRKERLELSTDSDEAKRTTGPEMMQVPRQKSVRFSDTVEVIGDLHPSEEEHQEKRE